MNAEPEILKAWAAQSVCYALGHISEGGGSPDKVRLEADILDTAEIAAATSPSKCLACQGSQFLLIRLPDQKVQLAQCHDCGTGYTCPRPGPSELESHYSETYYGPENVKFTPTIERIVAWVTRRRAEAIHRAIPPQSRVLEIGCGRGLLLGALARLGHECFGTERSELAARRASQNQAIHVYTKPLGECGFQKHQFDLVILWHVLEHLEDPDGTLRGVYDLMKPGGLLLIEVPNYTSLQSRVSGEHWFHLDVAHHLQHFSRQGLLRFLQTSGFQILKVTTFNIEQGPYGALQSLLNLLGLPREQLYRILKREDSPASPARLANYALGAALLLPALLFSLLETLLGRGAVLRVSARKRIGEQP